ncbi:ABC transporter ATP-binding protein [Bowmanella dokdonensis]|uniref:ABC transporter ATP-binding protein n=1 Tax=Bowmanella dokdonensis TaxID=751969 RepID=A0A939DM68_9ALTE|nr:ABC transporter ATP-binding protein [Bowmanella dokdonensis]MBN7825155.1 ABC transporter ATP-binding protein [Bowmanella dokdonensis]
MQSVVALDNVSFAWEQLPIVTIRHWRVARGQKVFLYGPSGSGKSTLLNLLSGILRPQSGSIRVLDQDLTKMQAWARDRFRARHIGMVFQQFNLLPYLSVRENIELAAYFSPATPLDQTWLDHILQRLELTNDLLNRKATGLSVGQQQRVAVARALLNRPELLIADEPTSALDTELRDNFLHLLLGCVEETGASVIFVSHDRTLKDYFDLQLDLRELAGAGEASPC